MNLKSADLQETLVEQAGSRKQSDGEGYENARFTPSQWKSKNKARRDTDKQVADRGNPHHGYHVRHAS